MCCLEGLPAGVVRRIVCWWMGFHSCRRSGHKPVLTGKIQLTNGHAIPFGDRLGIAARRLRGRRLLRNGWRLLFFWRFKGPVYGSQRDHRQCTGENYWVRYRCETMCHAYDLSSEGIKEAKKMSL